MPKEGQVLLYVCAPGTWMHTVSFSLLLFHSAVFSQEGKSLRLWEDWGTFWSLLSLGHCSVPFPAMPHLLSASAWQGPHLLLILSFCWWGCREISFRFLRPYLLEVRSVPATSKSKASLYTEACFKVLTSSKLVWVSFLLSWRYVWKGKWEKKKKDNVLVDWTDWFLTSRGNFIYMCYLTNSHKNSVWEEEYCSTLWYQDLENK